MLFEIHPVMLTEVWKFNNNHNSFKVTLYFKQFWTQVSVTHQSFATKIRRHKLFYQENLRTYVFLLGHDRIRGNSPAATTFYVIAPCLSTRGNFPAWVNQPSLVSPSTAPSTLIG